MKQILTYLFLSLFFTATAQIPTNGLVAYYPLNGNATDASGSGFNGTNYNAVATTDRFGNANAAFLFNGTNARIEIADNPTLRLSTFSLSVWVLSDNPEAINNSASQAPIVAKPYGNAGRNSYNVWYEYGYILRGNSYNASNVENPQVYVVADKLYWHHYVYVFDPSAGKITLWMDGRQAFQQSISTTTTLNYDNKPIRIGGEMNGFFKGSIDDVRFYNRALTQAEMIALYEEPDPQEATKVAADGLFGSYPFSGNVNDTYGTNHGSINGATLTTDRFGAANSAYSVANNTYISIPDAFVMRKKSFTYSLWINPSAASNSGYTLLTKTFNPSNTAVGGSPNGIVYNPTYERSIKPLLYTANGNLASVTLYKPPIYYGRVCTDKWTHLAMTVDDATKIMRFYADGKEVSNVAFMGSIAYDNHPLFLGALNSASNGTISDGFTGKIDDIKLYNRALSASEIKFLATEGTTSSVPTPITPPSVMWEKCLDTLGKAAAMIATGDGNYLIASYKQVLVVASGEYREDIMLLKITPQGEKIWFKQLGGSADEQIDDIKLTSDGGFIIAASAASNDGDVSGHHGATVRTNPDMWIVRLDANGTIVWQKSYGGTAEDRALKVIQKANGGFIAVGYTRSNDGEVTGNHGGVSDAWIVNLDAWGEPVWFKTLGGTQIDQINAIYQLPDGKYIIGGSTNSNDGDVSGNDNPGTINGWLLKLNISGSVAWQRVIGGAYGGSILDVRAANDGGIAFCGSVTIGRSDLAPTGNGDLGCGIYGKGDVDAWVGKTDDNGVPIWLSAYGTSASKDHFQRFMPNDDFNGYWLVGDYANTYADAAVVRIDNFGNLLAEKTFGGDGFEYGQAMTPTSDGGFLCVVDIAGSSSGGDHSSPCGSNAGGGTWLVKLGTCNAGDVAITEGYASGVACLCPNQSVSHRVKVTNNTNCPIKTGELIINITWSGANTGSISRTNTSAISAMSTAWVTITGIVLPNAGLVNFTATISNSKDNTSNNNTISYTNRPRIIESTNKTLIAILQCDDNDGWTHYFNSDTLVLSIFKNENGIGNISTNNISVQHSTTPQYGNTATPAPLAPYAGNNTWRMLNRYWRVTPASQPASDVRVRFYFSQRDIDDILAVYPSSGLTPSGLIFGKINGTYDPNPATGHTTVPKATGYKANGYWEYANGTTASTTKWQLGQIGTGLYYSEFITGSFSGGIGGVGFQPSVGAIPIQTTAKVFLQGCYDATTGKMNDDLRVLNLIPTTEPYSTLSGFTHTGGGGEQITSPSVLTVTGDNAIVDWVFLEWRDATNAVKSTTSALVQRDGDIVGVDGVSPITFKNAPSGSFYLTVRHRNHLGVKTLNPLSINANSSANFDFSPLNAAVYGVNAQKSFTSANALWSGDVSSNGQVKYNGSSNDRALILSLLSGTQTATLNGYYREDINMNGQVKYNGSGNDRALILSNLGGVQTATIIQQQ